jgi:hypothetical protein
MSDGAAPDTVKRLQPTLNTVRALFLFSGNQCAFPDCQHELLDVDGDFVAQTCHIAAAEPAGPRFDAAMTNDQRRSVDNLLLMCHKHHKKTDNVDQYPVGALHRIKSEHETRWKDVLNAFPVALDGPKFEEAVNDAIASAISDPTDRVTLKLPETLNAFVDAIYDSHFEPWQRDVEISQLHAAMKRLPALPVDTRKVFEIFIRQAARSDDLEMLEADLRFRLRHSVPDQEFTEHLEILEDHRVLRRTVRDGWDQATDGTYDQRILSTYPEGEADVPVWETYALFCRRASVDAGQAIETLDFTFLD